VIDETIRKNLEMHGAAQVRIMILSGGLPQHWTNQVIEWLSEQDGAERVATSALIAEQARVARSADRAAWTAAIAAIIAAIVATIGAVITYIAWIFPHAPV
jgi:hypothetical protein